MAISASDDYKSALGCNFCMYLLPYSLKKSIEIFKNENYGCHFIGNQATWIPSWRPKWPLDWQSSFKNIQEVEKSLCQRFQQHFTLHVIFLGQNK